MHRYRVLNTCSVSPWNNSTYVKSNIIVVIILQWQGLPLLGYLVVTQLRKLVVLVWFSVAVVKTVTEVVRTRMAL